MASRIENRTQIFRGQNNNPLSEEEKRAFWDKIVLFGRFFSDDNSKMEKGIEAVFLTPTGCEQVREFINNGSSEELLWIDCSRSFGENKKYFGALEYDTQNNKKMRITPELVDKHSAPEVGAVIFHELCHYNQPTKISESFFFNNLSVTSDFLSDSETQALSAQLALELHTKLDNDISYQKSFEANKQKWLRIAREEEPAPKGLLKFQPVKGLSEGELQHAQNLYAHQMASLETRTQFIKDYLNYKTWGKDHTSLTTPSYYNYAVAKLYHHSEKEEAIEFAEENHMGLSFSITEIQSHLKNGYGLTDEDFSLYFSDKLKNTAFLTKHETLSPVQELEQDEALKAGKNIYSPWQFDMSEDKNKSLVLKTLKQSDHPKMKSICSKIEDKQELSQEEKAIAGFEFFKLATFINKEYRVYQMAKSIGMHQETNPKPNEERTKMIKELEQIVGREMPVVQQQGDSSNLCARYGQPVDENDAGQIPLLNQNNHQV